MKTESFTVYGSMITAAQVLPLTEIVGFTFLATKEVVIKRILFNSIGVNDSTDSTPMTIRQQIQCNYLGSGSLMPQGYNVWTGECRQSLYGSKGDEFRDLSLRMRPSDSLVVAFFVCNGLADIGTIYSSVYVEYQYEELTIAK